jgi:hypothetical protein
MALVRMLLGTMEMLRRLPDQQENLKERLKNRDDANHLLTSPSAGGIGNVKGA